jgi:hypothetical protein
MRINDSEKMYFAKRIAVVNGGILAVGASHLMDKNVVRGEAGWPGTLDWVGTVAIFGASVVPVMAGAAYGAVSLSNHFQDRRAARQQAERRTATRANLPVFEMPTRVLQHELRAINNAERDRISLNAKKMLYPSVNAEAALRAHPSQQRAVYEDRFFDGVASTTSALEKRLFAGLHGGITTETDREAVCDVIDAAWFLDQTMPIIPECPVTPTTVQDEKHWYDFINARVQSELTLARAV